MPISKMGMECIFEFMNANVRLNVSRRCPECRPAEKLAPLWCDSIRFGPTELRIDDEICRMGIIRHYPNGETPEYVREQNEKGGWRYDVDRYGFESLADVGRRDDEVLVEGKPRRPIPHTSTAEVHRWRTEVERLEREKAMRVGSQRAGDSDILRGIEKNLKELRAKIQPHDLKRDRIEPPYKHYVELKILVRKGQTVEKRFEYMEYNKPLHEMMKYLINRHLGRRERAPPVRLNKVTFNSYGPIRIPLSLNLWTPNLKVNDDAVKTVDAVRPIINRRSFPLECIELREEGPFQSTIINNARSLVLSGNSLNPRLGEFNHRRVHLNRVMLPRDRISELVRIWGRERKAVGTWYTFSVYRQQFNVAKELLIQLADWDIGDRLELPDELRETEFPTCLIRNLTDTTHVKIYIVPVPGKVYWNFTLKVHLNNE